MADFDTIQATVALSKLVEEYLEGSTLTPAERLEVIRIGEGLSCNQSAEKARVSKETIRARRKRIYQKLEVPGCNVLIAKLLAHSLERVRA